MRLGERVRKILEIDDIVQDTLIRALEGLERFEPRTDGAFRNWLARCVENAIIDTRRAADAAKRGGGKVRRFADFPSESLTDSIFAASVPSPSVVARTRETEERLEAALLSLPEHYRELIVLRRLCDLSYAEIATAMSFDKEETARRACNRAVQKLETALRS